jgi:hypothetical protein
MRTEKHIPRHESTNLANDQCNGEGDNKYSRIPVKETRRQIQHEHYTYHHSGASGY